ncbi:MAG: hypothetical protein HW420_462 [Candidatus Nitrosotenuis sp.]|nr:hypothetical protein [Candidatus Nitrosotenuis sp.]
MSQKFYKFYIAGEKFAYFTTISVIYSDLKNAFAEVSKPGQPRGTQDQNIRNPFL